MRKITKWLFFLFAIIALGLTGCKKGIFDNPGGDVSGGSTTVDCVDPSLVNTKIGCYQVYAPVCGCDGKTYSNDCEAKYRGGVKRWTKGPCGVKPKPTPINGCIDSNKINPTIPCLMHIDPVCGCNGVTYNNACEAKRNGVTSYKKGHCKNYSKTYEICDGEKVRIGPMYRLHSVALPLETYKWTPATGLSCTTCKNPYASPSQTTTYTYTLTVTSTPGYKPIGGGKGILPGGCYGNGMPTSIKTYQYTVKVKNCLPQ